MNIWQFSRLIIQSISENSCKNVTIKLPLHKLNDLTFSSFSLPQCPRLDAVGFIWELLSVAEGRHRAGLHAGADSRSGPAVLALLHPVAAGQDHRGGSQQGAGFTSLTGL